MTVDDMLDDVELALNQASHCAKDIVIWLRQIEQELGHANNRERSRFHALLTRCLQADQPVEETVLAYAVVG